MIESFVFKNNYFAKKHDHKMFDMVVNMLTRGSDYNIEKTCPC